MQSLLCGNRSLFLWWNAENPRTHNGRDSRPSYRMDLLLGPGIHQFPSLVTDANWVRPPRKLDISVIPTYVSLDSYGAARTLRVSLLEAPERGEPRLYLHNRTQSDLLLPPAHALNAPPAFLPPVRVSPSTACGPDGPLETPHRHPTTAENRP
jgi:hypothetical protein